MRRGLEIASEHGAWATRVRIPSIFIFLRTNHLNLIKYGEMEMEMEIAGSAAWFHPNPNDVISYLEFSPNTIEIEIEIKPWEA